MNGEGGSSKYLAANGACGEPGRTPQVTKLPLLRDGRALTQRTEYFPSDSWDQNMNNNQETNQTKGSDAPQASEQENPLPEASAEGDGQAAEQKTIKSEESSTTMEMDAEVKKEGEEKPKSHTCGSQRKRFKWFISQGYEYEEASDLAKEPQKYRELRAAAEGRSLEVPERDAQISQQRKSLNRIAKRKYTQLREHGYSVEEAVALAPTLTDDPGERQKHLKSDESRKSGDAVKMIITVTDYPRTVLTEEQAKQVKEAVLKQVVDQTVSKTKPHFAGCNFVQGYLVFDCLDQQTITWLQYRARELNLWDGCSLKAISERHLKNSDMFTVKLTDSEHDSDEDITNFLSKQNDGIETSKWIFAERKLDEKTKTVELLLKVDPVSAKALHELNNKLNYKFEQITLKRISVDLFDSDKKPKTPAPPNRSRPYRGGYFRGPPGRGGRGGGYNSYNNFNRPNPATNSFYDQQNRNFGSNNFGGDYIDGLLDQLNRSLNAPGSAPFNPSTSFGRGGGRGRGGNRNYNRQRFF